jgi:ribosomal protein S18 acetylase RimI-like enzyme
MIANLAPLERPVWSLLNGPQAHLATVSGQAARIDPRYGPFAAAADQGIAAQADLAGLVRSSDDQLWLVEAEQWPAPPGTQIARIAPLIQMVAEGEGETNVTDPEIVPLGLAHVEAMTELALATEPGPWRESTHQYGQFFGIFDGSKLAAMAGERMRPGPGLAEVSGVCTWPEYRGQGMARRLIERVMAAQRARGDTPFLHSYAGNEAAIGLYQRLGFVTARSMVVTVLASS